MLQVTNNAETRGAEVGAQHVAPAALQNTGVDFRSLLLGLYNETTRVVKEYADPEIQMINLKGIGTMDKNSAAFIMASSIYLQQVQTQFETELSYVKFILQTAPSILENALRG